MIANIINSVAIVILAMAIIKQAKTISELKEDVWELKYKRDHISLQEQNDMQEDIARNKQVVESLISELDMKIEPIEIEKNIIHSYFDAEPQEVTEIIGYKVVGLTETEREAKRLRNRLEELEENTK